MNQSSLRRKAEALLDGDYSIEDALKDTDLASLLQELRIHQIELKLQNEELQNTQQELFDAQQKYQEYYQLAPVCYLTLSTQGVIIEANLRCKELLASSQRNIIDRPLIAFLEPECHTQFFEHIETVLETDNPLTTELIINNRYASQISHVFVESKAVTNNGVTVVWTIMTDITERRLAEIALQEAEERYRTVADFSTEWTYWQNPDGSLRYVSPSCQQITGYSAEEIQNTPRLIDQMIHEDDQDLWNNHPHEPGMPESTRTLHFRIHHRRGMTHWIEHICRPVIREDGTFAGYRISNRDITQEKLAQIRLQDSEERLDAFFSNSPVGLGLLSRHGDYLLINDRLAQIDGVPPEAYRGKSINEVLPAEILGDVWPILDRAFEQGQPTLGLEFEYTNQRSDTLCVIVSYFPIHNAQGEVTAAGVVLMDITDRKSLEQRTIELKSETERIRILSDFIRDAAHEFKTPLSIIMTNTYMLKQGPQWTDPQEVAAEVDQQVWSIRRLVDELLMMARLDAGYKQRHETVEIAPLISIAVSANREMIDLKNLALQLDLNDQHTCIGDRELLQTAIANILSNAVRYTLDGGHIRVTSDQVDDRVLISFEDSGVGMSDEELTQAFNRFFRVDKAHTTAGFGLGLPITRKIIEIHHGSIAIQSENGEGTLVTVELPQYK